MSNTNKPDILLLLSGTRIGAVATVIDKRTKEEDVVAIPEPEILKALKFSTLDSSSPHSTVSSEIEFSRNLVFNKIVIKVWMSVPTNRGEELAIQGQIVRALHDQAVDYIDNGASPILQEWAQQRNNG